MLLTRDDHAVLHVARDLSLIALSLICSPFSIIVVVIAKILTTLSLINVSNPSPALHNGRKVKVLVTGVGMAKGMFLARALYQGGCTVICADFETPLAPVCGKFSRACTRYYSLTGPKNGRGLQGYIQHILKIVQNERIDIWISCSGVATAIEDALVMRTLETETKCKCFQFDKHATFTLDDKYEFMRATADLGLTAPRWFLLDSPEQIGKVLKKAIEIEPGTEGTQYILKNVVMDDLTRGNLPLLSSDQPIRMAEVLESLDTKRSKWIMQQYISGEEEYCTHSIVVDGHVKAFTACPSTSVLMHYRQLHPGSPLDDAMLRFTQAYATGMYARYGCFTGHLSFDFLALNEPTAQGLQKTLMPIECNPRCHTAVVNFRGREKDLTSTYLSVLPGYKAPDLVCGELKKDHEVYYWIAHDLVVLFILPIIQFLLGITPFSQMISKHLDFWSHILLGKDPSFEWWDPLPWLVLNHVYWPGRLFNATWRGIRWSQVNVSTGKMFEF
jgi:hypothetical protein